MQDDRIEHKVVVEGVSPRSDNEPQDSSRSGQGLLSRLYSLVSPRAASPSPSSREMEERQALEIKDHQEEIRRLREELTTKRRELQERVEEIRKEREDHRKERELQKELQVAAPPDYTGAEVVRIHPPVIIEEKEISDVLPELSVPNSDPEQTNDDASVFDAAADELLESKLSTESSQHRLNEERVIQQQQQQIDDLNQEIIRLQADFAENFRKETAEVERLNLRLIEERRLADEVLENERRLFAEILEERRRAGMEIQLNAQQQFQQAELQHQQEVNILRDHRERIEAELVERVLLVNLREQENQALLAAAQRENQNRAQAEARAQADLAIAQELIVSERREVQSRAAAELLLNQQREETLRTEEQAAKNLKQAQQASIAKDMSGLGI